MSLENQIGLILYSTIKDIEYAFDIVVFAFEELVWDMGSSLLSDLPILACTMCKQLSCLNFFDTLLR
jgi:hypothetical protein